MKPKNIENRLTALEVRFAPPEPWKITAQFKDGHTETMSAEEYARVKLADPDSVFVVDRELSNNLNEFRAWLDMVHELAFICDPDKVMEI